MYVADREVFDSESRAPHLQCRRKILSTEIQGNAAAMVNIISARQPHSSLADVCLDRSAPKKQAHGVYPSLQSSREMSSAATRQVLQLPGQLIGRAAPAAGCHVVSERDGEHGGEAGENSECHDDELARRVSSRAGLCDHGHESSVLSQDARLPASTARPCHGGHSARHHRDAADAQLHTASRADASDRPSRGESSISSSPPQIASKVAGRAGNGGGDAAGPHCRLRSTGKLKQAQPTTAATAGPNDDGVRWDRCATLSV